MRLSHFSNLTSHLIRAAGKRAPVQSRTLSTLREENLDRYRTGGYHRVRIGDEFKDGQYQVVSKLGYGMYSTVWLVRDKDTQHHLALKILTADSYGGSKDTFELDMLKHISSQAKSYPGEGPNHVLGLLDQFSHSGPNGNHMCLIFKAMGPDMVHHRRLFPRSRVPVPVMKRISGQLLAALAFLHDSCRVIHTDIKPQNILVETPGINDMLQHAPSEVFQQQAPPPDPDRPYYMESSQLALADEDMALPENISVRLADFGTSSWFDRHLTEWIQPSKLRAPEVIIGVEWDHKVDIWNLSLVIWELVLGQLAFDGQATATAPYSSEAHLAQMRSVLGPMPASLLERAKAADKFYDANGNLRHGPSFPEFPLTKLCDSASIEGLHKDQFLEFIRGMLQLEPRNRLDAKQLLQAKWLKDL